MEWIINNYQTLLLVIAIAFLMLNPIVRYTIQKFALFGVAWLALYYLVKVVTNVSLQ